MILWYCVLLILPVLSFSHEPAGSSSRLLDIPYSGFISGTTVAGQTAFRVVRKVSRPVDCKILQFQNIPTNASFPLRGGRIFSQDSKMYNFRKSWNNGKEILSFVEGNSNHGTWMVGNTPGVDEGYVYLKPNVATLCPDSAESENDGVYWHALDKKNWAAIPEIKLVCLDEFRASATSFFEVEYYDVASSNFQVSFLYYLPDSGQVLYFDKLTSQWTELQRPQTLMTMGAEVVLTSSHGVSVVARFTDEERSQEGWGLTFRSVDWAHSVSTWFEKRDSFWGNKEELNVELDRQGRLSGGYELLPPPEDVVSTMRRRAHHDLSDARPGDYVWMWQMSHSQQNHSRFDQYGFPSSYPLGYGRGDSDDSVLNATSASPTQPCVSCEVTEVVLRCFAKSRRKVLFHYEHADRRVAMGQTVLARDNDWYVYSIPDNNFVDADAAREEASDVVTMVTDNSLNPLAGVEQPGQQAATPERSLTITLESSDSTLAQHYSVVGVHPIGNKPWNLLKTYIREKEKRLGDLSSCYFYHAAVSFPAPFIYAAEMLCVLMGAKPVTLIQYTSSTDEQWKFPLVRELSSAIIAAKKLLDDRPQLPKLDLDVAVLRYLHYETLVLYRGRRRYIVENLLPRGQAQALHPMPFPETHRLQEDYRLQIYYAAWNGLLLGYPSRFVESYCLSFHNDLSELIKMQIYRQARKDIDFFLVSINQTLEEIHLGLDPPLPEEFWEIVESLI